MTEQELKILIEAKMLDAFDTSLNVDAIVDDAEKSRFDRRFDDSKGLRNAQKKCK